MTAPVIPTFIVQDAWYNLTTGQINPSVADTVPNITFLQPSSTYLGPVDGLVGSLDGEVLYLAGLNTELDGGQKWLMWVADSLATDDGVNVFCPFVNTTLPGRWRNTGTPTGGPGALVSTQFIKAGGSHTINAVPTAIVNVFVQGRQQSGATTIALPGSKFTSQVFNIKDTNGDVTANNIIVTAPSIDGATSDTITIDYGARSYVWSGSEWSVR